MREKKIYIEATGCNRRLLETEKLRRYLSENGYTICDNPEESDFVLFTTCAFKDDREEYSVYRLQQLRKYGKKLMVYGCLPDIAPHRYEEFKEIPHLAPKDLYQIDTFFDDIRTPFDAVAEQHEVGSNSYKEGLWSIARRKLRWTELSNLASYERACTFLKKRADLRPKDAKPGYYLQICRGCRGQCTYCSIRRAVGGVVSLPVEKILHDLREGFEKGVREFVLLGDDPGCYGLDCGSSLPTLLQELCREADHLQQHSTNGARIRFHINEIHPKYLIAFVDDIESWAKEGHIQKLLCPVQSGNDRILEQMKREHSVKGYEAAINRLRQANSQLFLSTQIIAGFPGETEEKYQQSLDLIVRLKFDEAVIFGYDDKVNTAAGRMDEKVSGRTIRRRVRRGLKYLKRHGIHARRECPA